MPLRSYGVLTARVVDRRREDHEDSERPADGQADEAGRHEGQGDDHRDRSAVT